MTEFSEPLISWAILFARLTLALLFLVSGIHKMVWYQKALDEFIEARVVAVNYLLPLTIILHIGAGFALISGHFVSESSLLLALFVVLATVKVHCFWRMQGELRLARSRIAMANLAIVGSLVMLAAIGPGSMVL